MENNSEANEFAHYFTTKSAAQGYYSGHSSKTDQNTPIGLWKSMPISKGDVLNVSAHSFFNQDVNTNHNAFDVNVFVNNTINTYNLDENGNFVPAPFSLDNLSLGIGLIPSNPNTAGGLPDAGFVLVFYEARNDTIPVHQERVYVSQKNSWEFLNTNYTASHTGRVEIFCFNTSDIPVYFDNLQIELNPTLVVQENHYYPFGMNLAGIEKQGNPEDKFQFQGVEKEVSFGLNWNETLLRGYDLQLGRWHQIDIKASERESPYVGMGNNPIKFTDVLGDTIKNGARRRANYFNQLASKQMTSANQIAAVFGGLGNKKQWTKTQKKTYKRALAKYKDFKRQANSYKAKIADSDAAIEELKNNNKQTFTDLEGLVNEYGETVDVYIISNDGMDTYHGQTLMGFETTTNNGKVEIRPTSFTGEVNTIEIMTTNKPADPPPSKPGEAPKPKLRRIDVTRHEGGHVHYQAKNTKAYHDYLKRTSRLYKKDYDGHAPDDKSGLEADKFQNRGN